MLSIARYLRGCRGRQVRKVGRGGLGWADMVCLLLDRIKREKGVWWMPWQQEAMKDVILCDKLWGAENRL